MGFPIPVSSAAGDAVAQSELNAAAIQRQTANFNLAALQAAGGVLTSIFNVGSPLPSPARLLSAEVITNTALAGVLLTSALATVQGGSDAAGSIVASASSLATGTNGAVGTNPYPTRSGQQITLRVTLIGINLSALTAGDITVNLFYAPTA